MDVFACRDISNALASMAQITELIESTPFRCRVQLHPEHRVGLLRVEYNGHSEEDIRECDLKLTARVITFFEAKGSRDTVLTPLEFGPRWFLGLTNRETA